MGHFELNRKYLAVFLRLSIILYVPFLLLTQTNAGNSEAASPTFYLNGRYGRSSYDAFPINLIKGKSHYYLIQLFTLNFFDCFKTI